MAATLGATTPLTRVLLESNPGPMTLDGTNTWIVQAPGASGVLVVDPGQLSWNERLSALSEQAGGPRHDARALAEHLEALAELPVELILLTHQHFDHADAAPELARRTGAPVRALQEELSIDAPALRDGEILRAAGVALEVVHTPGHTADSTSFYLPEDGPGGSMLTGDTILGRGTTVLGPEQNALGAFLASLERLRGYGAATVLPGHGELRPSLEAVSDEYLAHRRRRLDQVRAALEQLGPEATEEQIVELAYTDIAPHLRPAAAVSVTAQLEYLRAESALS